MKISLRDYRQVLLVGNGEHVSLGEIANADLVVAASSGRVLKDRYGIRRYLADEELAEVKRLAKETQ